MSAPRATSGLGPWFAAIQEAFSWIAPLPEGRDDSTATCAYVPRDVYARIERACKFPEGDPVEVLSADSRAESQSALNGPSGSPTSPSGRVSRAANSQSTPEGPA